MNIVEGNVSVLKLGSESVLNIDKFRPPEKMEDPEKRNNYILF